MKVLHERKLKNGRRICYVELRGDEVLTAFPNDGYVRMPYPFENDVFQVGRVIDAVPVYWDDIHQKWEDVE